MSNKEDVACQCEKRNVSGPAFLLNEELLAGLISGEVIHGQNSQNTGDLAGTLFNISTELGPS